MELNLKSPRILFKKYLEDFPKVINIRWSDDGKTWTKKNLDYFRKLAKAGGYDCYPDTEKGVGEYLVDLCWENQTEWKHHWLELAHFVSQNGIKLPEEAYLVIMFSRNPRRRLSERLQIEGFAIDYCGELTELGSQLFSD